MVRPQVLSPPQDGNCCTKISSIFQFFPSRLISYKWTWCCTAHLSDSLFVKHSSLVSAKSMVSREDLCKYYGVDIICPELGHEDETENCCNRCYLFAICEAFFCSQKTRVENCSKKVVNVSQVPALQGTWRFPAASCSVSLIMYRRGGHLFLFFFFGRLRQLPWLQTNPSLFQTRVVLSFSLCVFLWLPRLPWFLISGLLHVRLTDRLCDSSIPYLQVTQPVRHSYNQMLIRSHSTKSYVNAPSRAAGGDVQQK